MCNAAHAPRRQAPCTGGPIPRPPAPRRNRTSPRAPGGALRNAGLVAAATGAHAYVDPLFARVDRGAGRPRLRRLPYFPQARGSPPGSQAGSQEGSRAAGSQPVSRQQLGLLG